MPDDLMTSGNDILGATDFSSFDSDASAVETPAVEGVEAGAEGGDPDLLENVESATDQPVVEAATPEIETPRTEIKVEGTSKEALPEGVRRVKDSTGKDGLLLSPEKWQSISAKHDLLSQFEQSAGEPMTAEALDARQRAYDGQERLYTDLLSGDPGAQGKVLQHFIQEGQRALAEGEITTDPAISLATTFYSTLRDSSPDAYAHLRMQAAQDLVNEIYDVAAQARDNNLYHSAGHIAKALSLPFKSSAEQVQFFQQRSAADPTSQLQQRIQQLEGQLNGRQTQNTQQAHQQFISQTKQSVQQAISNDVLTPSLSADRESWKDFPDAFNDLVVGRLASRVNKAISEDVAFNNRIANIDKAAFRATPQKKAEYAAMIKSAFVNRAKMAVDSLKGGILAEAAKIFKANSDAKHDRRQAGEARRAPVGVGSPVPRSLVPNTPKSGEFFDAKEQAKRMTTLFQ